MAAMFCVGLLLYYAIFLRGRGAESRVLARLLWMTYLALGCSAMLIAVTGVLEPVFQPNYPSILFLLMCITMSISGFLGFRSHAVRDVIATIRGQALIEAVLIGWQAFAIAFFLPFALSSFSGDVNANRLELTSRGEMLGSYGLINTVAGLGSHLFVVSLTMAFIRLCQPAGEGFSPIRVLLLVLGSLSYVIYILAYVGRDGSIYWLMTALMLFVIFRKHMPQTFQRRIIVFGASLGGLLLLPIVVITIARFGNSDFGVAASLFEYFGAQIHHFSDYASIDRPRTDGGSNFPLIWQSVCPMLSSAPCESWEQIRPSIFAYYFAQGKEPWVFATYVSDFIADFGNVISATLIAAFSVISYIVCVGRDRLGRMSLARLLLTLLLFLTPYWGVFYFRFSISNSFIFINLLFIGFVWVVQGIYEVAGIQQRTQNSLRTETTGFGGRGSAGARTAVTHRKIGV